MMTHFKTRPSRSERARKQPAIRRTVGLLLLLGALLEFLYLAFCLLSVQRSVPDDPIQKTWLTLFPWLPGNIPGASMALAHIPWLAPTSAGGYANFVLFVGGLAILFVLLAVLIGQRIPTGQLTEKQLHTLFWVLFLVTGIFVLTLLWMPISLTTLSPDMFFSGLYGRMVVDYHVNPYITAPATFSTDTLLQLSTHLQVTSAHIPVTPAGPVWMDLSILTTLGGGGSVARVLLGFRLLGLVAHLGNMVLIWSILTNFKPEMRVSATLFYAWNPLVLILGVTQMQLAIVMILFVLLAMHFFQRNDLLLSWVFILLAILVHLSSLILLPLIMRIFIRKTRFRRWFVHVGWWSGLLLISALVVVLAYAPFWNGWGLSGFGTSLLQVFWPNTAINSLDAALFNLPHLPANVVWLFRPHHWALFMLLVMSGYLLFVFWLVDNLALLLLCESGLFLLFAVLQPDYWPWYMLCPLTLALCSGNRYTLQLAFLLMVGALFSYYFWQWQPVWSGQGLVTVGIPCVLWGWCVFFSAMWQRIHADELVLKPESRPLRLVRPPWLSRPSWSSRPGRRGL